MNALVENQKPASQKTHAAPRNLSARRSRARGFVLQGLYQWSLAKLPACDILAQMETKFDMRRADVQYYRGLLSEVINGATNLDPLFEPYLDRSLDELDPISVNILRIAVCEMSHHWEVPYKVVIDEAVNLAKKFGPEQSYSFINGVLDKASKQLRAIERSAGEQRSQSA